MNYPSPPERYSGSKTLHWLIALLAFSQPAMGKFFEVDANEADGLFGWRLTHTVPGLPRNTPGW